MAEYDVAPTHESAGESIPQVVVDKFDEIFSPGKLAGETSADAGVANEKKVAEPTLSPREVARRAAAKKEQAEELDEEGITGVDNPDGDAPETTETPAEEAVESEEGNEPAAEEAAVEPLDPNLRFAAQQFGWSDEKIDRLHKADPEMATETFGNLLEAYTNLSRQYVAPQPAAATQPQTAQQASVESQLDKLYRDLASFSEENGNSLVERFLKPLKEEVIEPFRQMQAVLAVQQQQAIAAEATTTIDALADKFGEVYGKDDIKLTLPQRQAREQLVSIADRIRAGAQAQGVKLSVRNALNQAHLIVTSERRVEEGRQQVKAQVQKRARAITAKPTQRSRPMSTAAKQNEAAALEAYSKRAEELGLAVE